MPPRASSASWRPVSAIWPRVDDDDARGALNGRQAVGDDDRRAPGHQLADAALDHPLGLRVDAGGRLVEDQDLGLAAAGRARRRSAGARRHEKFAPRSWTFVSRPSGRARQHPIGADPARGGQDARVVERGIAEADVVAERPREHEDVLAHDDDPPAQQRWDRSARMSTPSSRIVPACGS